MTTTPNGATPAPATPAVLLEQADAHWARSQDLTANLDQHFAALGLLYGQAARTALGDPTNLVLQAHSAAFTNARQAARDLLQAETLLAGELEARNEELARLRHAAAEALPILRALDDGALPAAVSEALEDVRTIDSITDDLSAAIAHAEPF